MIAYSREALDKMDIQREAAKALDKALISRGEYERICQAHPVRLYTPNIFVRFGLLLLTVVAVVCGTGLFLLVTGASSERVIGTVLIFFGVSCYVVAELFVQVRNVYRAGVDDALIWMAAGLIFGGASLVYENMSAVTGSWLVVILAGWGMLRYADSVMALVAYGALISAIYHITLDDAAFGSAILPFVVMSASVASYFVSSRLASAEGFRHHRSCLILLQVAALVTFYLSGNFYVAQHVHASIHGEGATVPLGWLWWGLTCVVPVFYIVAGLRRKDVLLLWTGMGLVAAAIFTVRFYHPILPAEWAMIAGGIILIAGAYGLIRYLRVPKEGVTSVAPDEPHLLENLPVEGLAAAEALRSVTQPLDQGKGFGGGSGGGAGASGTY